MESKVNGKNSAERKSAAGKSAGRSSAGRNSSGRRSSGRKSAKHRLMDLLARRDHSPKEVRDKLAETFEPEEIEEAVAWATEKSWLPGDEDGLRALADRMSEAYHRRKKGARYINEKLRRRGLPEIQPPMELELEKALELVNNKFQRMFQGKPQGEFGLAERVKVQRFLLSRGFDPSVVRQVLQEVPRQCSNQRGWRCPSRRSLRLRRRHGFSMEVDE
ncbi:MAG: hypothetical protein C5B49_01060 [Bdellovibrio sp.]|nr:MAG: hypothetical protein C5B49_01060 [Bdellovibrio sp.]